MIKSFAHNVSESYTEIFIFSLQMFLCAFIHNDRVHSYAGGNGYNNQWSNPAGAGMNNAGHQHQQGFGGYNGGGGQRGGSNNFGQGGGRVGGYTQNRGGQQWQSGGPGAEVYKTNVFNEPDRYGYDYTIPGATVHYLMYKKREY